MPWWLTCLCRTQRAIRPCRRRQPLVYGRSRNVSDLFTGLATFHLLNQFCILPRECLTCSWHDSKFANGMLNQGGPVCAEFVQRGGGCLSLLEKWFKLTDVKLILYCQEAWKKLFKKRDFLFACSNPRWALWRAFLKKESEAVLFSGESWASPPVMGLIGLLGMTQ